jgi:hypothetical protein
MVTSADTLLRAVDARLSQLLDLEDDWDSYGGKPPSVTAILVAGRLTQSVYDRFGGSLGDKVLPTSIAPLAYGGIELEWGKDQKLLALDIGPDGAVGAMMRSGVGDQTHYKEIDQIVWDDAIDWVGKVLGVSPP